MPIKDATIYPPYWKQFSEYIRFERAGNQCEECGVENGKIGARGRDGIFLTENEVHGLNSDVGLALFGDDFNWKFTKIVLTVAHLDHEGGCCRCKEETGRKCAKPDHVLALCQRCHLTLDMPKHIANRQATLAGQKDAVRGLLQLQK